MTRLNTVRKWWQVMRTSSLAKSLQVSSRPYDELPQSEKDIVYSYWSGGDEWKKRHPEVVS